MKKLLAGLAVLAVGAGQAMAQKEVTIAHQDMLVPYRVMMASGEIEKATGYKINWRMFGGGGDVIRAMASGDVQLGEAGSSPIAAGASQGLPIKVFWILDDIASAEVLIARNGSGVNKVEDLKGKKVGVPFVSTTHFHLLYALELAKVNPKEVEILNMRPPEVAAAWERGDIDATFIWPPVLTKIKSGGKVIVTSGELSKKGKATFDGYVVNEKFARENPQFMIAFVKALAKADADYRSKGKSWTASSPQAAAVAKITKADPKDVPEIMSLYAYPTIDEQMSTRWLGGGKNSGVAKSLYETSRFLKDQGRIQAVAPDYGKFVTDEWVKKAK